MKNVVILGSTGSIGTQALEVIRKNPEFKVVALGAGSNIDLLTHQIIEFRPKVVAVANESLALELRHRLGVGSREVLAGLDGMCELAGLSGADIVLSALVGMVGIKPALAAINAKKTLALANKETLVAAGHLIMPRAKKQGVKIIPVDSEHSAIFQCLSGQPQKQLEKLILTASGGAFLGYSKKELRRVTPEQALQHPNWTMGAKVTVDSATMINKGLEVIEASWLFEVAQDLIDVVIHRESIIHSMVQFCDGAVMAQMAHPDMRIPISYALGYPDRLQSDEERIDFSALGALSFERPNDKDFPGIVLARQAALIGGSMPAVFNAANEKAVELFLTKQIAFCDIYRLIRNTMDEHKVVQDPDLDTVFEAERWAKATLTDAVETL